MDKKKRISKPMIIVLVILALLLIAVSAAYLIYRHYVGLINYQPLSESFSVTETLDSDVSIDEETLATDIEDSPDEDIQALKDDILTNLESNASELVYHENVLNVLLIGTDARDTTSRGRSDSMIILSINKETKEIVLSSLMRDIYLNISGVGYNRLNVAFNYGGAELLIDTVESNFGIDIDKYVRVNFNAFETVIDSMGGVTMELTSEEVEIANSYLQSDYYISASGGTYQLTGKQALAYSRIRYTAGSDFARTERQRKVLTQMIAQAKSLSIGELNTFMTTLLPELTTDFTEGEIFSLLLNSPTLLKYDIVSFRVPVDGTWQSLNIDRKSVLGIDFQANREALIAAIYKK